ncbi:MAG: tRNA pseudouridine(55) synthase TruB [Deltaproteobacteria bacterium]|nr:tRNA pseudouridine(55) synthase TruB [Deltaproteobacteria bacterium]
MSVPGRSLPPVEGPGRRHGVLLVDKPAGLTSHDVVELLRRLPGVRRSGHAGTLDPLATGLLVVCINEATKASRFLMAGEKEYLARVRLGIETDTQDVTGTVTREADWAGASPELIAREAAGLVGEIEQVPPMYSAVKQGGVRLHVLARAGKEVDRAPRKVSIRAIEIESVALPELTLRVTCAKGTYIRTLAWELGRRLGCGATLAGLRRTRSGRFSIEQAQPLEALLEGKGEALGKHLIPLAEALAEEWTPSLVDADTAARAAQGQPPDAPSGSRAGDRVMILGPAGGVVALTEVVEERSGRMRLRTIRVLHDYE